MGHFVTLHIILPIPIPAFPLSPKGTCFAAKGKVRMVLRSQRFV